VAVEADGGFEAELLVAQMLSLTGRRRSRQRLAELDGRADGDAELGRLAIVRATTSSTASAGSTRDAVAEEAERRLGDPAPATSSRLPGVGARRRGQTGKASTSSRRCVERATGGALVWAAVMANYGSGSSARPPGGRRR